MDAEYILKKKENFEELFNKVENRKIELYKKIEKLERIVKNMIAVPVLLNAIIMPIGIRILGINSIVLSLIAATPLIAVEIVTLLLIENKIDDKKIPAIKEEIETVEGELDALYELKGLFKKLEILNQKEMTAEKMQYLYEDFKQISQDKDVNITFTDYLYYLYQEEKPSKIFFSSVEEKPTADRPYVKRLDKLFEPRVKKL